MDPNWLYNLPDWALLVGITSLFMAMSVLGLYLVRATVLKEPHESNDVAANTSAAVGVIYAVLVAMIAVASWQNYTSADTLVNQEANTAWELFHTYGGYPQPAQDHLRNRLRTYIATVIYEEWPAENRGQRSRRASIAIDLLVADQMKFDPKSDKETALFTQSLQLVGQFVGIRNMRLLAGRSGLMPQMWIVVLVGAFINIGATYFVFARSLKLQACLTALLGFIIGMNVYMIFAMDHPALGEVGVQPSALQELEHNMDEVMSPTTPGQRRVAQ